VGTTSETVKNERASVIAKTAVLLQSAICTAQSATLVTLFSIAGSTAASADYSNNEQCSSSELKQVRQQLQQSLKRGATAAQQRDAAVKKFDTAYQTIKQRDQSIAELSYSADTAVRERVVSIVERHAAVTERDAAVTQLNAADKSIKQCDTRIQELTNSRKAERQRADKLQKQLTAATALADQQADVTLSILKPFIKRALDEVFAEQFPRFKKELNTPTGSTPDKRPESTKVLAAIASAVVVLVLILVTVCTH
jgi:membrane-associated HD superfamily phosphohydrolase